MADSGRRFGRGPSPDATSPTAGREATLLEEKALETFSLDRLLDFLTRLVTVPSLAQSDEQHRAGERETLAQKVVLTEMKTIGLETDFWPIDLQTLARHPSYSAEIVRSEAFGLVGSLGSPNPSPSTSPDSGPTLILNGHVDVVPVGDPEHWTSPPFRPEIRAGHLYGRGAADMKGGLACGLFALDAVHRAMVASGSALSGRVHLLSVVGEEDGGLGTLASIERGYRGDAAIIMEPTSLEVVCAQAGCANFRLTVPGLSAHGSRRGRGVSAIEKFAAIHRALLKLESGYNRRHRHRLLDHLDLAYPLSVGKVRAGDWASSVPELLEAEGRFGVAVGSTLSEGKAVFEEALAEANRSDPWLRENPAAVEWWGGQFEPAETSSSHPLVTVLGQSCLSERGREPRVVGVPYGADMRLLVHQAQTPTVLFGPGDVDRAHAVDESVPVADLEVVCRTLIRTIVRYCH